MGWNSPLLWNLAGLWSQWEIEWIGFTSVDRTQGWWQNNAMYNSPLVAVTSMIDSLEF